VLLGVVGAIGCCACVGNGTIDVVEVLEIFMKIG
jgi:hypothetical protein